MGELVSEGSLFDSVEIIGLFGDQNEIISFDNNEKLKILYGLNAAGKTTVLSIINATLTQDFVQLLRLPFERIIFSSKRYSKRNMKQVPINAEPTSEEYEKILALANNAEFLSWTEGSDEEGEEFQASDKLEIPNDYFVDYHKLTISKIKPSSLMVKTSSFGVKPRKRGGEFESKPSLLISTKHELERKIFTENEDESKLFDAIDQLNHKSDSDNNKLFKSFGGKSIVEYTVRALDKLDISKEKWESLRKSLASEYAIEIQDNTTPKRYQWDSADNEYPDISIKDYDEEGGAIRVQDFIDDHLPSNLYRDICNNTNNLQNRIIGRTYLDSEGNEIGCSSLRSSIRPPTSSPRVVTPIDYFLQNDYHLVNTLPHQINLTPSYRLYDEFYYASNTIYLSSARTVGEHSSQKSELIDFANSMRSKYSEATTFLQRQVNWLSLIWQKHGLSDETIFSLIEKYGRDNPEQFAKSVSSFCLSDSKSTDNLDEEMPRIIENTDTSLELIRASIDVFRDEIEELINIHNVQNISMLAEVNDTSSKNIIHLHDDYISIEKICVAIDDLTSIFRLKRMLENHFGKKITLDNGRFLFSDISSNELTINQLSSGEKQLLLLYWKILEGMNRNALENIVLIDEPELSLHISWQRDFVENLLELLVNQTRYGDDSDGGYGNVKIIIATHSPSILANHFDSSYELGLQDGV